MADPIDQYDPIFQEAGKAWNIDPLVLKALAKHESGGRADAVGSSGELGLTQIMPATAQHLGMTDRRDPAQQIWAGAKYLAEALDAEHDNPYAALAYYNGGPRWRSNPRRDPNYPSYVGGQYQKYAKASTGSMTDAAPAPAPAESTPADSGKGGGSPESPAKAPADMTDAEWLDAQSKTYPGLAGPNADRAQSPPADTGKGVAVPATKPADKGEDDAFTRALNAPEKPASTGSGTTAPAEPDAFTRALNAPGEAEKPQPGILHNLGAGIVQGAADVVHSGADLANWVDQRVPFLARLDKRFGIDPAATANLLETKRQEFEAGPGQTTSGTIGRFGGQMLATAPLMGPVGEVGAAGANLLARGATGLVPFIARNVAAGAAGGAAYGAATEGGSPVPVGQQIQEGAESGALLGPAFAAGAKVVAPIVRGVGNLLEGSGGAAREILWKPGTPAAPPAAAAPTEAEQLAARVAQATGREPPAAPGATPPGQPQPVGAQWSGNRIVGITPAEEAAYRVNAEGGKLIEPQTPGVPDRNAYVEGVNPNLAEQEQQVNTARELKSLNIRSTEASQQAKEIAAENNQARTSHLNNATGAETDILRRTTQRQADIQQAKPQVFAPANVTGPVDHVPVVSTIEGILAEPANRQNTPVQKVLRPLLDRMQNADGSPKILDPQEWWGLRQDIDRMTSPRMQSDDPNLHYAAHQLNAVSNAIDAQIEKVAPGYDAMIAKYAEHSRAIGAMRVLQDEAKKVYAAGGRMTFEGVQRMMKHIVDMRNADPTDLNPYKQISEATMQRLWGLRDDLRRSASAIELAKTPGSDTGQNLWDMIKGLASGPEAQHALHAFAATHFGMPGYVASRAGAAAVSALRSGAQGVRDTARAQQLLRPTNLLNDPYASGPP